MRSQKLKAILEKSLVDEKNYVGTAFDICQLMGWELPTSGFEERDKGVYYQCVYAGGAGDAMAEGRSETISPKKKLAKQNTAMNLLQQRQNNHYCSK